MSKKALQARVTGRVLGVNFRSRIHRLATRLDLTGYVKALPNRTLEIFAEGRKENLDELVDFLEKGPDRAEIEKAEFDWQDYEGKSNRFTIKYAE